MGWSFCVDNPMKTLEVKSCLLCPIQLLGRYLPSKNSLVDNIRILCLNYCDHLTSLLLPPVLPPIHSPYGNHSDVSNTLPPKPHPGKRENSWTQHTRSFVTYLLPIPLVLPLSTPYSSLIEWFSGAQMSYVLPPQGHCTCSSFHWNFLFFPIFVPGKFPHIPLDVCHLIEKAFLPSSALGDVPHRRMWACPCLGPHPNA